MGSPTREPSARFIDALVNDLQPVRRAPSSRRAIAAWAAASWAVVTASTLATGPLREGALLEALTVPTFTAELLLGSLVGVATLWAGLEIGVPGGPARRWLLGFALLLVGAWLALLIHGLARPSLEPTMAGKRAHCVGQVFFFALPPLALALWQIRRRSMWTSPLAGIAAGFASASIPALWMQIACMYSPRHTLTHHVAPALIVGLVGLVGVVADGFRSTRRSGGL